MYVYIDVNGSPFFLALIMFYWLQGKVTSFLTRWAPLKNQCNKKD